MRVLVVEDSITAAKQLINIVNEIDGFEVVGEARNGAEALKQFKSLTPDIICMDIVMPIMDGLQAARTILQLGAQTHIVMISSLGAVGDKAAEALRIGAKSVISKPFEQEQVEAALRSLQSSAA
jgi:two-component system chemotaxis response regulator CheY